MKLHSLMLLPALMTLLSLPAAAVGEAGAVAAPAQDARTREQILTIIDLSGLTGLGIQARHVAQQALNAANAPLGQQYDVVDRIAPRWAPEQLQQRLSRILNSYDEPSRQKLQATFSSRRLLQARTKEQEAIRDQGSAAYLDYVRRLRQQPPPAERQRYIQELDSAMQFSALLMETRAAVYPQLQAVLPGWQPPASWQDQVRRDVTEFLLYVHRTTPNDELQRLTEAYREPVLQTWLQSVRSQLRS